MNKIRFIRIALISAGFFAAILAILFARSNSMLSAAFVIITAVMLIGHTVYTIIFWHCPHCGKLLPTKNGMWNKHCPHCGKELD